MLSAAGRTMENGKLVGEIAEKGLQAKPGPRLPSDVERWLGPLSTPEKQVPVVHDYLRGHRAIAEAEASGAAEVRGISLPVWQSAQRHLDQKVAADPEVQQALRSLFIGHNTPRDPAVITREVPKKDLQPETVSLEVPTETPPVPQARVRRRTADYTAVSQQQRASVWNEFAIATEAQDQPRIDMALERIKALHEPDTIGTPQGQTPDWQRALEYMAGLEQQAQQWRQMQVPNQGWSEAVRTYRKQSGIDDVELPRYIRNTVDRFDAWADAQKPATTEDLFTQALGVPRAVMSSADFSAPGRQGLLMISRPEYWNNFEPMFKAWNSTHYLEAQKYIRDHPNFPAAQEAGLALTDLHSKLAPKEEAFQSQLAERLPLLGDVVRSSEQAYTTFLNRLRFDVFSNSLQEAAAAGLDIKDPGFTRSLAEWINTSTGRGGRNFNPGVLSTILFSPRLAISRFQTFNPYYYYKMNPYVRQQAIKANAAAAALVVSLVSLAGMGGAQVSWDFRSADAGKVRIGNTRLDFGGGHFQFLRLFTQLMSNQKKNTETGEITELGSRYGVANRLDVLMNFLIAKEAPVASFVTDWLRGKDMAGNKFSVPDALLQRTVPLAIQDVTDVLSDEGVQGLIYAIPASLGVGVQNYSASKVPAITLAGVKGNIPEQARAEYTRQIIEADKRAATMAAMKTKALGQDAAHAVLKNLVRTERARVNQVWLEANKDAYMQARRSGQKEIELVAPGGTE